MTATMTMAMTTTSASAGKAPRLDLHYRSVGTFLLAYATQLSRGELFLETPNPWPLSTSLNIWVEVSGWSPAIELSGTVAWTRPSAIGPGQPAGMGIALLSPIDAHGERIDQLAGGFKRARIAVVTGDAAGRAILTRYLQSLMTCEIVDPVSGRELGAGGARVAADGAVGGELAGDDHVADDLLADVALAVLDADVPGDASLETLVRDLRQHQRWRDIPIVVLAQLERDRTRAALLGVDEILPNPPPFHELQAAVMHAMSRPTRWTITSG